MISLKEPESNYIDGIVRFYNLNKHIILREINNAVFIGITPVFTEKNIVQEFITNNIFTMFIEIWRNNVELCRTIVYPTFIINENMMNIDKLFAQNSVDMIYASHVVEHVTEDQAHELLDKFKYVASKLIMVEVPYGQRPNLAHDDNIYEKHKCSLYPTHFEQHGYSTICLKEDRNPNPKDKPRERIFAYINKM
jgi:hypothetical protein